MSFLAFLISLAMLINYLLDIERKL